MAHTVCITGMGILASIGDDVPAFTGSLRAGTSGIRHRVPGSDPAVSVGIAAEMRDFSFLKRATAVQGAPDDVLRGVRKLGQRAPFAIQTSILAALESWLDGRLFSQGVPSERIGLIIAGQNTTQNYQYNVMPKFRKHPEYLSPRYALEFLETNQVGVLSELFKITGEGFVVGGASATGNLGIIKGVQAIRAGLLDMCMVVGVVADLSPMDVQGFVNIGAMGGKAFIDTPEKACRPFDARHEGFIYGHGSACVILESPSSAVRRGVVVHAEITGVACNLDGNSSSDPSIAGEMRAMSSALSDAGISAAEIDYVNSHGSSSPLGDTTEAEAISRVFGRRTDGLWINATKGLTGHCLWSAGVVELIATVQQMREGFIHPNMNLEDPIRKELPFCGSESIECRVRTALSNSFGFGGINTCVVVRR